LLPPAPSLTSVGQSNFFQQQQLFSGQIHKHAITSQPIGAPPSTPINEEINPLMMNRFCSVIGSTFQHQPTSQQSGGRVGMTDENFFLEHF
jgi:hypothetical protein